MSSDPMETFLFLLLVLAYAAGAFVSLISGKGGLWRGLVALCEALGAGAGIALAVSVILSGAPFSITLPNFLPVAGGLVLLLDPLGAFFLLLIGLVAVPAAVYGIGYTAHY